jgi:large subunit ribosomal protein L21
MVDTESRTEPIAAPSNRDAAARYAIIETGGKQYRVHVGDRLSVEKLPVDAGQDITFDRVLMVGGTGEAKVGAPLLEGATVAAQVEEQYRGPKIIVFKFKAKKRYRRRTGHRQSLTRVAITAINA